MDIDSEAITLDEIKLMGKSVGVYTATISPHIHERLERHILILKKLIDRSATKQRWLTNAIKEKLYNDSHNPQVPKANTINVKIDEELNKKVLDRIEFIKKFRFSYSKKQWLIDAVIEKLERDEKDVEIKMVEIKQSQSDSHKQQIAQLQEELAKIKNYMMQQKS